MNFTIEINIINHFLNNRAQTLNDYNLETEGVCSKNSESIMLNKLFFCHYKRPYTHRNVDTL